MTLFVWDAKYCLNIRGLDHQHRKLFDLFNELYAAVRLGHANEVIDKVLTQVVDYTVYHFATEEKLLHQFGYQDEAAHRAEHAQFTGQAKALARKLHAGQGDVAFATLKLLCDWLNNHILVSDRNFAPFLIERGVR